MMSLFRCFWLFTFAAVMFLATFAHGATRRVDSDSPNNGPGNDWEHAYWTTQGAVGASSSGDVIWVAGGTMGSPKLYKPANANSPIDLKNGVSIQGGYRGYTTAPGENPDDRDIVAFPTVLSGELGATDAYTVVRIPAGTSAPTTGTFADRSNLDGASITGGYNPSSGNGGGILAVSGSAAVVRQCVIHDNIAFVGGGAYIPDGAEVTFRKCRFEANHAEGGSPDGGAIGVWGAATLLDCVIKDNTAGYDGGGVKCHATGSVTAISCTFDSNTANNNGGAISAKGSGAPFN